MFAFAPTALEDRLGVYLHVLWNPVFRIPDSGGSVGQAVGQVSVTDRGPSRALEEGGALGMAAGRVGRVVA